MAESRDPGVLVDRSGGVVTLTLGTRRERTV